MPVFRVTLKDRQSGKSHDERVEAPDQAAVGGMIDLAKYSVIHAEPIDGTGNPLPPEGAPVFLDGKGLADAASSAAFVSIIFVPAAIAAFVLGGMAMEKSKGRVGGGAVMYATACIMVWFVLGVIAAYRFGVF